MSTRIGNTKERALVEAKSLLQRFGFNGFSFQHIADRLGIKKPSLFDHFESKDVLGQKIIEDYHESFRVWSKTIETFSASEKIEAFYEIFFRFSMKQLGLCPMSALIGDFNSISKTTRKAISKMYLDQMKWVQEVIKEGQKKNVFRRDRSNKELAAVIISLGIGCQFSARVLDNPEHIREMKTQAIQFLKNT